MATDWTTVENNIITAVQAVLGGAWPTVANGATASIKSLTAISQYIEANSAQMTADETQQLTSEWKNAFQHTLTGYAMITAAIAQNAISAALTVLINAVPALAGFV
jgi:hypothetical protein